MNRISSIPTGLSNDHLPETGTGYKSNAMQTVMADYYTNTLKNRGEVDVFSIIKFRHPTNGAVNTAEFAFPDTINSRAALHKSGGHHIPDQFKDRQGE